MSTRAALICLVLTSAASATARAQPAPVTTSSFAGDWALRGLTTLDAGKVPTTARVSIRCRPDGTVEVVREASTWVASGAQRRTSWRSTEVGLYGASLRAAFRPRGEWVTGLVGALEGAAGTPVTNENDVRVEYWLGSDGALHEETSNLTREAPEHFWWTATCKGQRLRAEDRAPPAKLTTLVNHGPQDARYDLVFVSEGYREHELPLFRADVRAALERLRATTPFKEYWRYLNVHRIDLPAKGSGVRGGRGGGPGGLGTSLEGHPATIAPEDVDWRVASGSRASVERAARGAGLERPEAIVVLVNDLFRSVAHDGFTLVSAFDHDPYGYARDPAATTVHELGHVIGYLLDEYEESPRSRWDFLKASDWAEGMTRWAGWGPNVTTRRRLEEIPWREWIPRGTGVPLPTPVGSGHAVGLYVGGLHMSRGWHRPSETCLMRDSSAPFCVVCREAIVLRLSQRSRPFDITVRRVDDDTVHLQVRTWIPGGGGARWSRNGGFLTVDGGDFVVRRSETPHGENELELVVGDTSDWIRDDPMEWSLWRTKFAIEKGYLWDEGVKVRGPWPQPKREHGGEELLRLVDRG